MSGMFGLGYLIFAALLLGVAVLLRRWYAGDPQRTQLVFWVLLALACPPLALMAFLLLKTLRIRVA